MSIPDDKYGNEQWTEEGYVYDLYVNSRNPFDPKDGQAVKKILQSLGSDDIAVRHRRRLLRKSVNER